MFGLAGDAGARAAEASKPIPVQVILTDRPQLLPANVGSWPIASFVVVSQFVSNWVQCGHAADIAETTRLTPSGPAAGDNGTGSRAVR